MPLATNQGFKNIAIKDSSRAIPEYIALAITKLVPVMEAWASGGTFKEISKSLFCQLQIPLPPLEVQQEIVAEIEGYQRVIDGARAVVENYRPHIAVDPEWPTYSLRDLAENLDSRRVPVSKGHRKSGPFPYYGASGVVDYVDDYIFDEDVLLISEGWCKSAGAFDSYRLLSLWKELGEQSRPCSEIQDHGYTEVC